VYSCCWIEGFDKKNPVLNTFRAVSAIALILILCGSSVALATKKRGINNVVKNTDTYASISSFSVIYLANVHGDSMSVYF